MMAIGVYIIMIYMGVVGAALIIGNLFCMVMSFIVYKYEKGKMSFWQFAKRWKV